MAKDFSKMLNNLKPSYCGKNRYEFFEIPAQFFGKDCTLLYKIWGFEIEDDKCTVWASRISKKTGKIPPKASLMEGFSFERIFGEKEKFKNIGTQKSPFGIGS